MGAYLPSRVDVVAPDSADSASRQLTLDGAGVVMVGAPTVFYTKGLGCSTCLSIALLPPRVAALRQLLSTSIRRTVAAEAKPHLAMLRLLSIDGEVHRDALLPHHFLCGDVQTRV